MRGEFNVNYPCSTLLDDNMAQIFDGNMAQNLHPFSGHFVIGKIFIFRSMLSAKSSNFDPCYWRNCRNFDQCHRQNPHTWTHNFVAFFIFRSTLSKKSNFDPCYRRNRRNFDPCCRQKSLISIRVVVEKVKFRSMLSAKSSNFDPFYRRCRR